MSLNANGIMRFADGSIYEGELQAGVAHGKGILVREHMRYDGQFENGEYSGNGILETSEFVYAGEFREGIFHGVGKIKLKTQIFPWLQLLKGNTVSLVIASFNCGEPHGQCYVQTELFEFTGLLQDRMYETGHMRLYKELALHFEPHVENLDCEVDMRESPWHMSYVIEDCKFKGFIDEKFLRVSKCEYENADFDVAGVYDANVIISGRFNFKKVERRNQIDYELTNEQFLPISEVYSDLSDYLEVPDNIVLPPVSFWVELDFDDKISVFEGNFANGIPSNGVFYFSNGVKVNGTKANDEFAGTFEFSNCKLIGKLRYGFLEGDFNMVMHHTLYGRLEVKGTRLCNSYTGAFTLDSDTLSYEAEYENGCLQGRCKCELKYCTMSCEIVYNAGNIETLCMRWPLFSYYKENKAEWVLMNKDQFIIVRQHDSQIVLLKKCSDETIIKKNYFESTDFIFEGEVRNLAPAGFGVLKKNGMIVTGSRINNHFEGRCKFCFDFPEDYLKEGNLINEMVITFDLSGSINGHCIIQYEESTFTGKYQQGKKHEGIWEFSTVRFEGQFEDGLFSKGSIYYLDKEIRGEFVPGDDLQFPNVPFTLSMLGKTVELMKDYKITEEGDNVLIESPGKLYSGEVNSKMEYHGHGILTTDDFKYDGAFIAGQFHGLGNYFSYSSEEHYEGHFLDGNLTGNFTVRKLHDSNFMYQGELVDGFRSGEGFLKTEQFEYRGHFCSNEFDGQGELVFLLDNTHYTGTFKEGFKHGSGTFSTSTFQYKGEFYYDEFQGEGTLMWYDPDGEEIELGGEKCIKFEEGQFKANELISGKRKTFEYTEEGAFVSNKLCLGSYRGIVFESVLEKFHHFPQLFPDAYVLIEGDFELPNLSFRSLDENDTIHGKLFSVSLTIAEVDVYNHPCSQQIEDQKEPLNTSNNERIYDDRKKPANLANSKGFKDEECSTEPRSTASESAHSTSKDTFENDNLEGFIVYLHHKNDVTYKISSNFLVDETHLSEIKYLNGDIYRGFLNQKLNPQIFGVLKANNFTFSGEFDDSVPKRGSLLTEEYEFSGTVNRNYQPIEGVIEYHAYTYKISGCFDENIMPLGICNVQFRTNLHFKGLWRHGIFYGVGEIDENTVIYEIERVPDEVEETWIETHPVNIGTIMYKHNKYEGEIIDGLPEGTGNLIKDSNEYHGIFVAGKRHGEFETTEIIVFKHPNELIANFADYCKEYIEERSMTGKGRFHNDHKVGEWTYEANDDEYLINVDNGDFRYEKAAFRIEKRGSDLSITAESFEFVGDLDFSGKLIIGELQFVGSVIKSKFEGQGALLTNELQYRGGFVDSEFEGIGRLENDNLTYAGEFNMGVIHGRGVMRIKSSGDTYSGIFTEGRFLEGKVNYSSGECFVGVFK